MKKIPYTVKNLSLRNKIAIKNHQPQWLVVFFTAICLLGPNAGLKGQFLDTIYDLAHNARSSFSLLPSGNIIFSGMNNDNPSLYQYAKLDQQGKVLDSLNLQYNPDDYFLANCKKGLVVNRNKIYNSYTNFHSRDSIYVILSKLSLSPLDTLETKLYYADRSIYTATHSISMTLDSDSTFLLSGYLARWVQQPDSVLKYDLFLTRFDTALNVIWETIVPGDSVYGRRYGPIGTDILLDSYGGILVTGNEFFYPFLEIGFAARFDRQGNHLWYKEYNGNMGMSGMYCVDNGDGTYQYVQNWWTTTTGGQNDLHVGRMDTMGNILTNQRFGKVQRTQFAQDLIRTRDGNFYISGIGYWGNFHSFGFKFTPQGDSLWYRTYHHDDSLDLAYVENFQEDADSNLVHFGYHGDNVNPRPGNGIFSWLYRTDQHGCIFEDCQLSQEELKALPRLGLYPNPAPGGRFFVERPANGRPAMLEIYNASGALLESHNLEPSRSRYRIHSALSPGSYLCLLRTKTGKELGIARVMIEQ